MNKSKGFTIIELIVVIAIIAVLAAIVLVNVTQYISKGKGAAIEGNMATLLTNGAVYFDGTPTGTGALYIATPSACLATGPIYLAIKSAVGATGTQLACVGHATTQDWCGQVTTMPTGAQYTSFCVDSTGYKGVLVSGKCTGATYTCQ